MYIMVPEGLHALRQIRTGGGNVFEPQLKQREDFVILTLTERL